DWRLTRFSLHNPRRLLISFQALPQPAQGRGLRLQLRGEESHGLGVGFRQSRKWIESEQSLGCFLFAQIDQLDGDESLRVDVAAQMPVDELNAAVWQAIAEQTADVAQLRERIFQCPPLIGWMPPPVVWMRHQVAGANRNVVDDAIADGFFHGN